MKKFEGIMEEVWRNMTLNLLKRGASREDECGKFWPIKGLRGTLKIPRSTPESLSSSFRVQMPKKYEGMWRKEPSNAKHRG